MFLSAMGGGCISQRPEARDQIDRGKECRGEREREREIYIYDFGFGRLVGLRGCPVGLGLVRWSHVSVVACVSVWTFV